MEPHDASATSAEPGTAAGGTAPARQPPATEPERARRAEGGNMLPGRNRRRLGVERLLVRLIATFGIVAIGVALGAILVSQKVEGWIVGLVIALVTVILSAVLWSSRQL